MREILFRGKRIDNGEWVYGDLHRLPTGDRYIGNYRFSNQVIPESVGQFTGLTDKNGTKIFEGDLLDDDVWSVAYCDGKGEFCGMQAGWYVQRDDWESWYGLVNDPLAEVNGNIHDL